MANSFLLRNFFFFFLPLSDTSNAIMKTVEKIKKTLVEFTAPPSKAHTLRALMIAALADGTSTINNPLMGQDQLNMIDCLKKLGAQIEVNDNSITVKGCAGKFSSVETELNVGESGVTMNFLASAACLSDKPITITGAKRITERPVRDLVDGLLQLGCKIDYLQNDGFLPIKVHGGGIEGGCTKMNGATTSQYFSSLAISAPCADSEVNITCAGVMTETPYFDITLQVMEAFGVAVQNDNYKNIRIPAPAIYTARDFNIEGDWSSASFFFLAAAITKSTIKVAGLNAGSKQGDKAFVDIMQQMGCKVSFRGDLVILRGAQLNAIEADLADIPDLLPPIAIAAAFAQGKSRFTNIAHLRLKECDRVAVMASELAKMGILCHCEVDSITIEGAPESIVGAQIDTHNDHRIAMSFAAAGLVTGNQVICDETPVAKSFPDFWEKFAIFHA
jgi:3-phosphoshikimate 1-carboxyvinyltransferase